LRMRSRNAQSIPSSQRRTAPEPCALWREHVRRRGLRTVPQHRLNHIRRRSVLGKPVGHHEGLFAHLGLRFALGFSVRLARNRACAERLS